MYQKVSDYRLGGFHRKIKNSMEDLYSGKNSGEDLDKLLYDCISTYKEDTRYRNDLRFLKIWFLYVILLKPSLHVVWA